MTSILLIDNDRFIINPLPPALRQANYMVWAADNGRSELELAQSKKPDLVVLDVLMSEMDGRQVCEALRSQSVGQGTSVDVWWPFRSEVEESA